MPNATAFTIELWLHLGDCLALMTNKRELPWAIASNDSYASSVLSNLPRASGRNSIVYAVASTI